MADNIEVGDLVARISFDDTGLEKSMADISRQMKLVESEFNKASSALQGYGSEEEQLRAKSDALGQQMQLQQQRINKLNEAFQESAQKKGLDAAETQKLATQLNQAQTQYNKMSNELQQVNQKLADHVSDLSKTESAWDKLQQAVNKAGDQLKKAGDKTKEIGESLTKSVTLPIAAIGGLAVKAAADFDSSMRSIQSALGTTQEEAEHLNEVAKSVWAEGFGDSLDDVADSIVLIKQQLGDMDDGSMASLAEDAQILKKTFEADVSESIRTASVMVKNFGIDGQHAMDLITVGFQRGGDFSGELLDTLREYSPQFASMGKSADEMLAILIAGAEKGAFNLDKVGDAVKEFNIRAQDGSKTTEAGFQMIGLSAKAMGEAIAAGGDTASTAFMATIAALAAMDDPLQQNIAGVDLFGTQWEDVRSQVILAMNASVQSLGQIDGATKAAGESLEQSFSQKMTSLGRQLQEALAPLGEILLQIAEQWLPRVSSALQTVSGWFSKLSPGMQQAVAAFGLLAAAIGPLLVAFGAIASAISALAPVFTVLLGPVGLVVAAIAGLAALAVVIVNNWGPIKGFFQGIWSSITSAFDAGLNGVERLWNNTWNSVSGFTKKVWGDISSFFSTSWSAISSFASNLWNGITSTVSNAISFIAAIPKQMLEIGKNIIQGLLDGVTSMFSRIKDTVSNVASSITDGLKNLLGIHSPSRVTMELGEYTGEGFALGLKNSLSSVAQQASALASAALPGMDAVYGGSAAVSGGSSSGSGSAPAQAASGVIEIPVYLDGREIARAVSNPLAALTNTRARGVGLIGG